MSRKTIIVTAVLACVAGATPALARGLFEAPPVQPDFETADQFVQGATGGYATVRQNGGVGGRQNVVGVRHPQAGHYLVKFNNDVSTCAAQATIAGRGKRSVVPAYIV